MNAQQNPVSASETQPDRLEVDLEATSRVVADAHTANLRAALESDGWERRGLLRRLTRLSP
jgi:hypothetical protein